jgi:hypothetical protein
VPVLARDRGAAARTPAHGAAVEPVGARHCTTWPGSGPSCKRYVEDGRYAIDNNVCENAIRPFVVGRRNWLFADTVAGANASANLYSLLQTCLVNGIDGYRYLRHCSSRCPRLGRPTTTLLCCPGASTSPRPERLLPCHHRGGKGVVH